MLKLAYRYVKENRRNTVICIIGMALSMTLIFSLIQTAEQIVTNYKAMIVSNSNYDIQISDIEEEPLEESQLQEIVAFYKEKYDLTRAVYFGNGMLSEVSGSQVIGVDGNWTLPYMTELREGSLPMELGDICIEESFAAERGLEAGMPLQLTLFETNSSGAELEYEFHISGIIADTPSYTSGGYMFTTLGTAQEILAEEAYQNAIPFNVIIMSIDRLDYPEEEISAIYTELTQKYGIPFIKHISENEAKYQIGIDRGYYYTLRRVLYGIVILLLVIMGIFVYYMMRVNLLGKIKQYGIFRSLGMDRSRLAGLIICEVMLYSIAGLVLGCLGGVMMNRVMTKFILEGLLGDFAIGNMPGENIRVTNYSVRLFGYAIGLAVIAVGLASLKIFIEIIHKKPIELLQNHVKNKETRYIAFQNVILELAWNNANRNRGQKRALSITMILSLLSVILLGNGLGSIEFDLGKGVVSFANIEVSAVRGVGSSYITDEDFESLKAIKGGEFYWQAGLFEYRLLDGGKEQDSTIAIVYSSNLMKRFRKANSLKDEKIVLCYTEELEEMGELWLYDGDKPLTKLQPQAIIPAGIKSMTARGIPTLRRVIIVDEVYAQTFLEKPLQITSVYLDSDNLTGRDVNQMLGNESYEYVDLSSIQEQAQEQLQSMLILVGYMMVSMITLAVFLITNTVRENFEQRRREIGMMRAAGGTRKMVSDILCVEILLSLLAAALVAGILAAPVSMYVYLVIKERLGMGWQGYAFGIPIVLLGSMLLVRWNVNQCMKGSTVELLRSEE